MSIKIIVMGVGGVGKSAITNRFVIGRWVEKYDPTIEESYQTTIDIEGKAMQVEILDTAGQDAYTPLRETFMHTGDGFLLVYSIVDDQTLEELREIREQILRVHPDRKVPMVVVGNKCDMKKRVVSKQEGKTLADEFGAGFLEISAKENLKVKDAFQTLVQKILQKSPKAGAAADGVDEGVMGGTGGVQEAVHRTLEEIRALIGGTAWAKFIPDDRADPLWVDLRTDLGLTGLEVASFKKYYYMPEDIKKGHAGSIRELLTRGLKQEQIDEEVYSAMIYYNISVLNTALEENNSGIAVMCYNNTKLRPKTATQARLAARGVTIDKTTNTGYGNIFYAFRDSAPLIIKKTADVEEIQRLDTYLDRRLHNEHIIHTELIDMQDGANLYAMPRVTSTAANLVKPISDAAAVKLIIDVVGAVQFLHNNGFAHMDIKPDNLGIDSGGNFILLDLGSVAEFGVFTDVTDAYVPKDILVVHGKLRADAEIDFWGIAITLVRLRGGSKSRYNKDDILKLLADLATLGLHGLADLVSKLN